MSGPYLYSDLPPPRSSRRGDARPRARSGVPPFFSRAIDRLPLLRPTLTKPTEEDKRDDSSDEEEEKNAPQIEEEDSDDEDSDDEEPVAKKAKVEGKDKKKKKKKSKGSDDDDSVNSDVVEDLSGDEVDTSNIIEGGRRSRKGRATVFTYTATDLAEDSDED